ncbi:hypothetical protein HU200_043119 [Digitaria exilis]|uniref:DNA repair protein REV1 n=1 Tax=Digitaria exilis TaxID=1010633 RepID=A0A835EFH1_9POAL|nr:hypothetical protein HU200_043119 [Digitaria exilis]
MSSTSSGRRAPSTAAAVASSPGQKRARDEASSGSPSDPDPSPAKNPRRAFASSPFADFGTYMAAKNSKLAAQFDADAATSGAGALGLFAGVSIFVDGFTVPSSQELKEIMLNNGGRFVNYFSRHTVTHIVCTNLPDSKMKNLRAFSKGLPVVKPAWVVDSLAENRLLNCAPYQISQNSSSSRKQTKLSAFFSEKQNEVRHQGEQNNQNKDAEFLSVSAQEGSQHQSEEFESEASMDNVELSKGSLSSDEQKETEFEGGDVGDFAVNEGEYDCETACSERRDNDMDGKFGVAQSPDARSRCSNLCSTSSTGSHLSLPLEKSAAKPSSRPHSTLTDPNFVENYFKYSRLHFIGTWRNRYRKRFSNVLEAKSINSNADHSGKKKTIIHIDMDCFFVSVVIRNMPDLHDKPVAVCHSDNPKGTAEISSANYPARNYGIKAGMFVRDAKARCPHLIIVPYNFDAYEEVTDQFYGTLHKHCSKVQALSCDEAFLDMTECLHGDPEEVTRRIRSEIFDATKCTASAGIAENMLLARLATRSAKPNGQCFIPSEKADDYLSSLSIKALPGIGHTVSSKLRSKEIEYCGQLRNISKDALHKDFGKKTGDLLWNYCRGIDHSVVGSVQETKSVGAEINWGVRFNDNKDAEHFLTNLCKEVSLRLQGCGVQGRTITLKVKTRREGAGEPIKYMGCGDCETTSRSMTIAGATDSFVTLQRIAKQLFSALRLDVKEVRGVGLAMSKLEHADLARGASQGNMLESWLASPAAKLKKRRGEVLGTVDAAGIGQLLQSHESATSHSSGMNPRRGRSTGVHNVELPPLSQLDLEVLKNLPPEIMSEMNDMYNGELQGLLDALNNDKGKEISSKSLALPTITQNSVPAGDAKHQGYRDHKDSMHLVDDTKGKSDKQLSEVKAANDASCSRACELVEKTTKCVTQLDLMPGSLSQADFTVLQELPEDVKADLFSALPLHRSEDPKCSTSKVSEMKSPNVGGAENRSLNDGRADDPEDPRIFHPPGSSQKWIEQFRVSSSLILNVIAEQHTDSGCSQRLSSALEPVASFLPLCPNSGSEEWKEAFSCLSRILRQYIQLKVETDIEELYKCFCLLKRFASASEFFLELHDSILPFLQVNSTYLVII